MILLSLKALLYLILLYFILLWSSSVVHLPTSGITINCSTCWTIIHLAYPATIVTRKQETDNQRLKCCGNREAGMSTEEAGQGSHRREIDQRLEDLGRRAYNDEFYLRYYVGHKGDYGHEFMVCDLLWLIDRWACKGWPLMLYNDALGIRVNSFVSLQHFAFGAHHIFPRTNVIASMVAKSGKLRYANNSNYKHDAMIRKEVCVNPGVVEEIKRIILTSDITTVDDRDWEEPPDARQELEIKIGNEVRHCLAKKYLWFDPNQFHWCWPEASEWIPRPHPLVPQRLLSYHVDFDLVFTLFLFFLFLSTNESTSHSRALKYSALSTYKRAQIRKAWRFSTIWFKICDALFSHW